MSIVCGPIRQNEGNKPLKKAIGPNFVTPRKVLQIPLYSSGFEFIMRVLITSNGWVQTTETVA